MNAEQHHADILDQFTKQAEPFLQRHAHSKDALLELMAECAAPRAEDKLLDVACGPGIVSCFFAKRVEHVTGLDVVPAMLESAKKYQADQQLQNVDWQLGESTHLPFAGDTFDCVVTRFSFHHFLEPKTALAEMKRVCKPGGTVVVCDSAPRKEVQDSFNRWETLRDPSHTRALTQAELEALGAGVGLDLYGKANFILEMELDDLLAGSFPKPGDDDAIHALIEADLQAGKDSLGLAARRESDGVKVSFPVVVLAWHKRL